MNELVTYYQSGLILAGGAILGVLCVFALWRLTLRVWAVLRGRFSVVQLFVFAILAAQLTVAAQKRGWVKFPYTDPTARYLTDRGSYTTNDFVHIDFTRVVVPDTATIWIDRRELSQTNDEDWVTFATGTFAEWRPPIDLPCENATNFNFVVYTDWTPGPSVVTNAVWHAFWGKDQRQRRFFIPLRTAVRVDGETIATPKSKEDANDEN